MTDEAADLARPVIAGVDGSPASAAAADLAAGEATLRGLPLELVCALSPTFLAQPVAPPDLPPVAAGLPGTNEKVRERAEQVLHEAAARVHETYPDLPTVTRLRDGYPAGVLTDASRQAALLVVGHRGQGGFSGMLAGSVAVQLASHAACPLIIARSQPPPADLPVVVGMDGSHGAQQAATFAVDVASRYGVPLVVLYAWPWDAGWAPEQVQAGAPPPEMPDAVRQTVTHLARTHPEVEVRHEVHSEIAAHEALIGASGAARLVVVGARGRGGFRGLLLGSVSQALIYHAHCPVAVVGPEADRHRFEH